MSAPAQPINGDDVSRGMPQIVWRVFFIFAVLVVLSLALYIGGSLYGDRMAQVGHSTSDKKLEIVIGNDVFSLPANMVRHSDQRVSGTLSRLDVQVHWPTMSGYTKSLAPQFSQSNPENIEIALLSISKRRSLLDMAERFGPVYNNAFDVNNIKPLSNGLFAVALDSEHGYINEKLIYSKPSNTGKPAFIARCQAAESGQERLLLPCEADLFIGTSSELKIRFAASQLKRWQAFTGELRTLIAQITLT